MTHSLWVFSKSDDELIRLDDLDDELLVLCVL